MLQQAIAAIRWTTCGNTPEDRGVIPTLWLTGTAGVGKSATAWHAFNASTTDALGYVDVDQVGMLYPDDDVDEYGYSLKNDAICALARNFAAAGAGRLLVSGIVDPREPGRAVRLDRADLRYCLLTVDDEVLRGRVAERGWDSVEADTIVAEQAELKDSSFAQAVIDTTEQTVGSVAERVMAELTALPPAQNDDGHVADAHQQVAIGVCSSPGRGASVARLWVSGWPATPGHRERGPGSPISGNCRSYASPGPIPVSTSTLASSTSPPSARCSPTGAPRYSSATGT